MSPVTETFWAFVMLSSLIITFSRIEKWLSKQD